MSARHLLATAAAVLASSATLARAAPSEQVPVGVRAIGMSGAYTSIADEVSGLFWNPAGLARVGHQEIAATHADLYGSDIQDNLVAFLVPLSLRHALAADWYRSGFDDPELDFGENRFDLAYSFKPSSFVSVGTTVKYLTRRTQLDGTTVRHGRGAGVDLGVLVNPVDRLRVGVVAQDVFDTRLDYAEGGSAVVYPRNLRAGASYGYRQWGTVALDVDDRIHAGLEITPAEPIAIRGGIERDREGEHDITWSTGLGLRVGLLRVDYANVQHPTLGTTHQFGVSLQFNFNPSQVRIEKVAAQDLYASQYKSYATEPFGTVRLKNLQDRPLEAKLGVYVAELMDAPTEHTIYLRPRVSEEVPLTAVMSEKALASAATRPVKVRVTTTYQSVRLVRTDKGEAQAYAYSPGAIDWSRGVAQAAAFVTPDDPTVQDVASAATRTAALSENDLLGSRNVTFAAAIFDALGTLGVAYVPDPNNPYSSVSETEKAVDTIRYPRETLQKGVGDCDDTSILVAALLENVGIATKLIDAPGHLFVAFDSGLHERTRLGLGVSDDRTFVDGGRVWIPVETTILGKGFPGFAEAWRIGAGEYSDWAAKNHVGLVDIDSAWARYVPGEPPGDTKALTVSVDTLRLHSLLATDAAAVAGWREENLSSRYDQVRKNLVVAPAALGAVTHAYFLSGRLDEARAQLEDVIRQDPGSAMAHNNLAVVEAARGAWGEAVKHCEAALQADRSDAGTWLNLGVARWATGDTPGARTALQEGLRRGGGLEQALRLLGVPGQATGNRASPAGSSDDTVRLLLEHAAIGGAAPAPRSVATPPLYWKE